MPPTPPASAAPAPAPAPSPPPPPLHQTPSYSAGHVNTGPLHRRRRRRSPRGPTEGARRASITAQASAASPPDERKLAVSPNRHLSGVLWPAAPTTRRQQKVIVCEARPPGEKRQSRVPMRINSSRRQQNSPTPSGCRQPANFCRRGGPGGSDPGLIHLSRSIGAASAARAHQTVLWLQSCGGPRRLGQGMAE